MDQFSTLRKIERHGQILKEGIRVAGHLIKGGDPSSLAFALGQLRGPIVKVAQFLANIPGFLPTEYSDALSQLQSHAPPMSPVFVKRRMRNELDENWLSHFSDFSEQPSYAASLGQVHQAVLYSGEKVACKLQYPRMDNIISTDIQQLELWLKAYNAFDGTINHQNILEEIKAHLTEELDYDREARNTTHFHAQYSDIMIAPKVFGQLSTSKLLTLSWEDGINVWDACKHFDPKNLAQQIFHAWYKPLFTESLLHSDPHPGNYAFHESGKIILFDFGCVRLFSEEFIGGIKELYQCILHKTGTKNALGLLGFHNLSEDACSALTAWGRIIFEPLTSSKEKPLHQSPEEIFTQARTIYQTLKAAGGVTPPREFVLMDRTAIGLGATFTKMQVKLNWQELWESVVN